MYLFLGKIGAIVETGVSQIIPEVVKNLQNFRIDKTLIKYIIILHSHFDHSGGVSLLKSAFPSAKVLGSSYAAWVLQDEHQVSLIQKGLQKTSLHPWYSTGEVFIFKEEVEIVKDGQEIDLGEGVKIKIMETPGHSPCSISTLISKNKAFIISDNFGSIYPSQEEGEHILKDTDEDKNIQFKGVKVWTTAFDNYELYLKNFERVKNFDIKYLGFGHFGVLQGASASSFFEFSKKQAQRFREIMKEKCSELKDEEEVIKHLQENELKELLYYFPPFIVRWGTRAMLRNISAE